MFKFIYEVVEGGSEQLAPSLTVRDEMLVAALLIPMAYTNLKAPLRQVISISDASEEGGAAAEASLFVRHADNDMAQSFDDASLVRSEEIGKVEQTSRACQGCRRILEANVAQCPLGCGKRFCSVGCFKEHKATCNFSQFPHLSVHFLGSACANLPWEFFSQGLLPFDPLESLESVLRPGLFLWCPSRSESQWGDRSKRYQAEEK